MNKYITIITIIFTYLSFTSCEDNYHDTGLANPYHECSMFEYMKTDSYNWDSTVLLVERAGLDTLFDGRSMYNSITFFGPTNLSIMQYLLKTVDENQNRLYYSIEDIPVEICREMILSHVFVGRKKMQDFSYENKGTLTGGDTLTNLANTQVRIYRIKNSYLDIPDIGPEALGIQSLSGTKVIGLIGSCNIETQTGIVHAMAYTYMFGKL